MSLDNIILKKYKDHTEKIEQELDRIFTSGVTLIEDIGVYSLLGG